MPIRSRIALRQIRPPLSLPPNPLNLGGVGGGSHSWHRSNASQTIPDNLGDMSSKYHRESAIQFYRWDDPMIPKPGCATSLADTDQSHARGRASRPAHLPDRILASAHRWDKKYICRDTDKAWSAP